MFDNLDDISIRIEDIINEQINTNKNEEYILRKWENTKKYFEFIQKIDDEKFYLQAYLNNSQIDFKKID